MMIAIRCPGSRLVALLPMLAATLAPSHGRADGLIQSLPDDGRWVRFDFEYRELDPAAGQVTKTMNGRQFVRSVGRTEIDDEPYRFVELKSHFDPDDPENEFWEVSRLLLPEKLAATGQNPLDHIVRAWRRMSGARELRTGNKLSDSQGEVDLERDNMFRFNLAFQLHGPLSDSRVLGKRPRVCKAGKFDCIGIEGHGVAPTDKRRGEAQPGQREHRFHYETWTCPTVPFGVVLHNCDCQRYGAGEKVVRHSTWEFKLAEIGTDARSEILDEVDLVRANRALDRANRSLAAGKYLSASVEYSNAISDAPTLTEAYDGRARAFVQSGAYVKGIADFREAIRRDPRYSPAMANLAWLLATCPNDEVRNGKKAIALATRACELDEWKSARSLAALAAAHAELGEFEQAVKWQAQAIELAPEESKDLYRRHLNFYDSGKPVRDESE